MKLVADLHMHTIASTHALSTVQELVRQAAERGLKAVAITDHAPSMPDSPHIWHFESLPMFPKELMGVRVLWGVEADVLDNTGALDMPQPLLEKLDWVVASMHRQLMLKTDPEAVTEAWLGVLQNPLVDCLGHMGSPRYRCDYERVVKACGDAGKLIEINAATFRVRKSSVPNCKEIARLCKLHGVPICVNSDAHFYPFVGLAGDAEELLLEVGFPEELIINADYERLERYLNGRLRTASS